MMKRRMLLLLAALLMMMPVTSLAQGRVTPTTPADPEIRETFGSWVETELVPWIKKDEPDQYHAKWSAARCKQVIEKVQKAGFTVGTKWYNLLCNTKREHRLYASEAFYLLVNSQYGENWEWTVEDMAWADNMAALAGIRPENSVRRLVPSAAEGTTLDVLRAAYEAITTKYGVTDEQWDAYDIAVVFTSGGDGKGGVVRFWEVQLRTDWNEYAYDFLYTWNPTTGKTELTDERK